VAEGPSVSVVIPTHQRREALRSGLESLASQTLDHAEYEVVVAVDASTDGTIEMLDSWNGPLQLRWVRPPGRGRAGACNAAVAAARGEVTIVLDDDMRCVPEFVERHLHNHPPGSRRCVLGAVPVELGEGSSHATRYVKEKFDRHLSRLSDPAHLAAPRSFFTGNASLRTEVMREVGGFDDSFGIYGNEDVELALRLRDVGVELAYDPAALARQEYGKGLAGLLRDTVAKGSTTVLLARAHPEVFGELRLAEPGESSRPWLAARAALLAASRGIGAVAPSVLAVAAGLERIGFWRTPLFYRAVLDYAFWAGVDSALGETDDGGDLGRLTDELHRGPIDLLLHR